MNIKQEEHIMRKSFALFTLVSLFLFSLSLVSLASDSKDKAEKLSTVEGTVVCIGCDLHKSDGANFQCSKYGHVGALKTSDGKIWSFIENDKAQKLMNDKNLHGKTVRITGHKIEKAILIDVQSFEVDGKKMEWCEKCNVMGAVHKH